MKQPILDHPFFSAFLLVTGFCMSSSLIFPGVLIVLPVCNAFIGIMLFLAASQVWWQKQLKKREHDEKTRRHNEETRRHNQRVQREFDKVTQRMRLNEIRLDINPLKIGSRVQHKEDPRMCGHVIFINMHTAFPVIVRWDNGHENGYVPASLVDLSYYTNQQAAHVLEQDPT